MSRKITTHTIQTKYPNRRGGVHGGAATYLPPLEDELENNDTNPDNIYYTASINNFPTDPTKAKAILAQYKETKIYDIVSNPEDYWITVAKFNIETTALPIFTFSEGDYIITMTWNGFTGTGVVPFIQTNYPPTDSQGLFIHDVYTYQAFIAMINLGFKAAYDALNLASGFTLPATGPPIMLFVDEATPLQIKFPDNSYVTTDFSVTGVQPVNPAPFNTSSVNVYFNFLLFSFFENFLNRFYGFVPVAPYTQNMNFQIVVIDQGNNVVGPIITMTQDYPTFYLWYSFKALLLLTNFMPVVTENLGSNVRTTTGDAITANILTDFSLPELGTNGVSKSNVIYNPAPQYRLTDLTGTNPMRTIDFQFKYEDIFNVIHDLYIPPYASAQVKFLFIKKSSSF